MANSLKPQEIVFQLDTQILKEIVRVLISKNYKNIQYIPSRQSLLAIVKEHQNIINYFTHKNHLLFYYSLFPKIYRLFMAKDLRICLDACFLNRYVPTKELSRIFSKELVEKCLLNTILCSKKEKSKFTLSFIPFENYILTRDIHQAYKTFELDPQKFTDRVWMGTDSIIFTRFLNKYLKDKNFEKTIEIGTGTGLQIICSKKYSSTCLGIDINKRAVQYTKINIEINNLKNIKSHYSNIFDQVVGKFDLILVNPWFINLEKSGLEEVPEIMLKLNQFLNTDGVCLMYLTSYYKLGSDTACDYFEKFVTNTKYDIDFHAIGYSVERNRINEYKKYGISYCISYNVVIKKNGNGIVRRFEVPKIRKIRDFSYINICRKIYNF